MRLEYWRVAGAVAAATQSHSGNVTAMTYMTARTV